MKVFIVQLFEIMTHGPDTMVASHVFHSEEDALFFMADNEMTFNGIAWVHAPENPPVGSTPWLRGACLEREVA
jgi:hypothetical protein